MARKLDDQQKAELRDFVDALYVAGGFMSNSEWARESGYDRSALSDLRNENGGIDGYNLLRLIRAAAARADLTDEQMALALARATMPDGSDRIFARRLDDLGAQVAEAIEILRSLQQHRRGGQQQQRGAGRGQA